jgi:hypothetical protein
MVHPNPTHYGSARYNQFKKKAKHCLAFSTTQKANQCLANSFRKKVSHRLTNLGVSPEAQTAAPP